MTGGIRTHMIGVCLGLSPSSFCQKDCASTLYAMAIQVNSEEICYTVNFTFTATPNANLSIRASLQRLTNSATVIRLLFCGTIANFISSRFHLYDNVINGLCRIFHRNFFECGYLYDKSCIFCCYHNYYFFMPNGEPSKKVYSLYIESELQDMFSFVENVIVNAPNACDQAISPIQ